MPVVRAIHWKEAEAGPLLAACRVAGFETEYREGDGGAICRSVRTKHIPIVFIGGDPAKAAVGLVDHKICAVDGRWSAMCFARKKS